VQHSIIIKYSQVLPCWSCLGAAMGIHGEIANESFIKQMKTAYTTPDQCKLAVSKMNHNLPNFPKAVP